MRPELRVVSAPLEPHDYDEVERVTEEIGTTRAEIVRRALRQYVAIHDYRRYIANGNPDLGGDIADDTPLTRPSPYPTTYDSDQNPTPTYSEDGRPCSRCAWGQDETVARNHCPYCVHFVDREDLFEDYEIVRERELLEKEESPTREDYEKMMIDEKEADEYFERFCEEQGIDDEYIVQAVRRERERIKKEASE